MIAILIFTAIFTALGIYAMHMGAGTTFAGLIGSIIFLVGMFLLVGSLSYNAGVCAIADELPENEVPAEFRDLLEDCPVF
jgi:hypothetical protein